VTLIVDADVAVAASGGEVAARGGEIAAVKGVLLLLDTEKAPHRGNVQVVEYSRCVGDAEYFAL
jgi:hypothetical protein